jgi:hypothetical protein
MNKVTAGIGSLALLAGSAFFVATVPGVAASAEGLEPMASLSASAVAGVHTGAYTEWQDSATAPVPPAGFELGEVETRTIAGTAETTGWVAESPGDGWVQVAERTVVDQPAWTEVEPGEPGFWANFEPTNDVAFEGPPLWPSDPRGTWSEPKHQGGPQQGASGVFHNGGGHGSWYYRSQGTPDRVIAEHPAVTHQEFRFERTTPELTQYRWQLIERTDGNAADTSSDDIAGDNAGSNGAGSNGVGNTDPADHDDGDDAVHTDKGGSRGTPEAPAQPAPAQPTPAQPAKPRVPTVIEAGL